MTANKKLLFVAHTGQLSSGGEISNYQLMDYLVRQGYEIQIIHPDWNDVSYEEKMRAIGVQPVTISYTHWRDEDIRFEEVDLKAINQICEVIRSFNPGVVITNTMIVPWGAIAAALMNKPHMWVTREFPIGELVYLNEKKDIIKKFSNIVIANSRELADSVSIAYDVRAPYFYSYVDVKDIHLDDSITQTRFVSPNNIIPRKNQKELIEALAIVKERNPDFSTQVVLIGNKDETYWKSVKKLIVDNGLDSLVIVHEFSKEPWGLVGKSDILVQTSLSESIGRTTTEAMKIGIPKIASDISGHREAFELGGGTLYKSGDAKDLADKIENALRNLDELQEEARTVKKKVKETMSEDACNEVFMESLKSLTNKRVRNPSAELSQLEPYIRAYVISTESMIEHANINIFEQQQLIRNLQNEIEALENSHAYRLGNGLVKTVRKIKQSFGRFGAKK